MKRSSILSALLCAITVISFISCNTGKKEKSKVLMEANEYHQKSLDLREEILDLERASKEKKLEYEEIKIQLKIWDKDIIEVP